MDMPGCFASFNIGQDSQAATQTSIHFVVAKGLGLSTRMANLISPLIKAFTIERWQTNSVRSRPILCTCAPWDSKRNLLLMSHDQPSDWKTCRQGLCPASEINFLHCSEEIRSITEHARWSIDRSSLSMSLAVQWSDSIISLISSGVMIETDGWLLRL